MRCTSLHRTPKSGRSARRGGARYRVRNHLISLSCLAPSEYPRKFGHDVCFDAEMSEAVTDHEVRARDEFGGA